MGVLSAASGDALVVANAGAVGDVGVAEDTVVAGELARGEMEKSSWEAIAGS